MKATGPEMHGNYPASEFPYADQSVDATGSETNAAHGGNTAPEAAVDPVAEGVPSTEQMVEIQKGGTISESFLEAWKAGEIEGLPGPGEMSTNEFLAKMYTAIHELDNNVAIMERMHISSNDLDLVHPGEDINLQPLIEHMQGKSLEEIANPVDLKIAPEVVEPVAADGQPVSETSASQPAGAPDTTAQPTAAESTPNGSESIYEKYPDMQFGAEALTAEQASRHPGVIAELSMRAGEGVTSELIQAREQLYAWLDPASHNAMYADNPVRALAEVRFSDLANNGTYLENVERALNARGLTMSSAGAENLANLVLKLDTAGLDGQQSLQGVLEKTLQNNFQSFTNEGGLRSIRMTFNDNPTLLTFKR